MLLQVANYTEAERSTVQADPAGTAGWMPMGCVIKVVDDGAGNRVAKPLADADSALLVANGYGVVMKISTDPYQVDRTTAPSFTGIRTVDILPGDYVTQVRDAYITFDPSLLDASLDASRAGTTPTVGQKLAIKGSLFCATSVSSAIVSPCIAHVDSVSPTGAVTVFVSDIPLSA